MFEQDVILAPYTNYKIGGPAKFFFVAKTQEALAKAVEQAKKDNLKIFILGGATNILVSDDGFDGLVIKPGFHQIEVKENNVVKVGASVTVKDFLAFLINNELAGFEWAGGLPGTVGGAIYGNAGAFKGETKDSVVSVTSLNLENNPPSVETRLNSQCEFGYRMSIFKTRAFSTNNVTEPSYVPPKDIILEAEFQFRPGKKEELEASAEEKIAYRQKYQPLDYPNIGSTHKNVDLKKVPKAVREKYASEIKTDPFEVMPAALLISEAGLKGKTVGKAQVSEKHPNFIINLGGAKASEVKELANLVKKIVKDTFDVELEREVIFL